MKHSRLIYSDFSNTVTNFNSTIRSLWIGIAGFFLVIIASSDSGSGFSGQVSIEGFIIFISIAIYFSLNYLLQNSKNFKLLFGLLVMIGLFFDIALSFYTYQRYGYHFVSALYLSLYSLVLLLIILGQKKNQII